MNSIAKIVLDKLLEKGFTVSTAESCTGGLLASAFVDFAGASEVFIGGVVTYSNESKNRELGVKLETLNSVGAVSPETAEQMANGVADKFGTDIGLSTTGIAGPSGGTKEKPVGLVYVGIYIKGHTVVEKLQLNGTRTEVRNQTVDKILEILSNEIDKF